MIQRVARRSSAAPPQEAAVRRRMPREARARQLLDLAEAIVVADGFAGLTMERLAGEAGIAKTVVYSHFANVSEVALALLERRWEEIDATFGALWGQGEPLAVQLGRYARTYLAATAPRRTLMTELSRDPAAGEAVRQRLLGRQIALGERLAKDYALPSETARLAASMILGGLSALSNVAPQGQARRSEAAEAFVSGALGLLGALAARERGSGKGC